MAFTLRTTGNYGTIGYRTIDNYGGPKIFDIYNNVNLHGYRIVNAGDPVDPQDYTTKSYVDLRSAGLDPKESCLYTTVSNIANFTVKATVEAALDPVATVTPVLANNNRVLVKNQTTTTENGIYWWQDSSASLVRTPDMNGDPLENVSAGNYTFVEQGDAWANTGWVVQGAGVLTLGVDPILWYLFSALPTASNVGTGTGLVFRDIVGQNFNFRTLAGGTDIGIVTAGNNITISSTATNVTLASAGGTSLVTDGVGPALEIRGLTAGTDIGITSSATALTINNTRAVSSLANAGTGETIIVDGTGPAMSLKSLTAGSGITFTPTANDITIAASAVAREYGAAIYLESVGVSGTALSAGVQAIVPLNATEVTSGGFSLVGNTVVLATAGTWVVYGIAQSADNPGAFRVGLFDGGGLLTVTSAANSNAGTSITAAFTYYITVAVSAALTLRILSDSAGNMGLPDATTNNIYAHLTAHLL